MSRALGQGPEPVQGFGAFLRNDREAVVSSLTLYWRSGAVECQVTRIKSTKCRSYGRASFALLSRVWPTADVLAIFRFCAADEVDFDVDLRELQGQGRLDVLCGFLREIGRRLGKPVLMGPEGEYGHPLLGFDVEADRVVFLAAPHVS